MMNVFKLDLKKLVRWLLPVRLRRKIGTAFLYVFIAPLEALFGLFSKNRDNNLYQLLITPQVCYLERMLNDRYDSLLRRITVADGSFHSMVHLFMPAELKPVYVYMLDENEPLYMYVPGESSSSDYDFVVKVPSGLVFDENQMRGEIDSYKLVGKKYKIERV
jgi:hypothetical protein